MRRMERSGSKKCWLQWDLYKWQALSILFFSFSSLPTPFLHFQNWYIRVNAILKWKRILATCPTHFERFLLIEKQNGKQPSHGAGLLADTSQMHLRWIVHNSSLPSAHFTSNAPHVQAFSYHKQFFLAQSTAVNVFNAPVRFCVSLPVWSLIVFITVFYMVSRLLLFITTQHWYHLH